MLKKDMEKKREEMIKKEAILRVRTEEEERVVKSVNMQSIYLHPNCLELYDGTVT